MLTEKLKLNRRNKAGLFFTLAATAASLIAGLGWAKSIGVALLGLALTWLIGAIRPIHACWAASLTGLLLASASVAWQYDDASGTYRSWRSRYDLLPETAKYVAHDPKTGQKEYWDEIQQRWLRLDQQSDNIESWEPPTAGQPIPADAALIPGTMRRNQFAAYLKERYLVYGRFPDDELVDGVLKRRSDLDFNSVNGEIVAQGDAKKWALLAHPASLRTALYEQRVLTSVGMAAFLGGLTSVWLVRRHTIKRHRTAPA